MSPRPLGRGSLNRRDARDMSAARVLATESCRLSFFTQNYSIGGADKNLEYRSYFKYSYQDRIRAIELCIELGKRVRPAIRRSAKTPSWSFC